MSRSAWKRAGVVLTAAAVVTGLAGCQDDGGDKGEKKAAAPAPATTPAAPQTQTLGEATEVIRAAYTKTAGAKAAKVKMTMSMTGLGEESGTAEMTGVQGWNPAVMDITMKGSLLAAGDPTAPEQSRMIVLGDVTYVDMGAEKAAERDGKRWMKLDMKAAAEASGDPALQKQMTGGLGNMNQDPAQQLALLLDSPDLKHVGAEKINGMETQHYKGTLTFEQMLKANKTSELLSKKDHDALVAAVKQAGLKGYDTEVWVNEDGYPARMNVDMNMGFGSMKIRADYSDYGTATAVEAPPAKDTYDLFEMLKELEGLEGTEGLEGLEGLTEG
ncbi:hypothetical protein ACIGW0_13755 [Streptomyces bikiniensis]|uniref:Lipoprotein n=1 Tax=Streptomyces bikiniensis TaxID=1896 RepID=A0ABW8CS95_STRBI